MATISTPVRHPFGVLDESKLRNLQSIKNRQNAVTPNSAPSLKRRAPSPEFSDSENIDPSYFESSIKRKRGTFEDDVSFMKHAANSIAKSIVRTKVYTPPITTTVLKATPLNVATQTSTPASAPAAAGRSPTRSSTRDIKARPNLKRRFAPPSISTTSPTLSIAAALRGTLAHKKASSRSSRRTSALSIGESQPKSWQFAIFEEPEEVQNYRMSEWTMTQSSAALDISDDESRSKSSFSTGKTEDRGKENVDPNEMLITSAPVTRSAAAAAAIAAETAERETQDAEKTEEPRTPLGDLNAADYYGEGLDATSVVLVTEDVPQQAEATEAQDTSSHTVSTSEPISVSNAFTFEAQTEPAPACEDSTSAFEPEPEQIPDWAQRTSLLFGIDATPELEIASSTPLPGFDGGDIEIWESESAKDENDSEEAHSHPHAIVIGEGQTFSIERSCLQEI